MDKFTTITVKQGGSETVYRQDEYEPKTIIVTHYNNCSPVAGGVTGMSIPAALSELENVLCKENG